MVRTAVIVVLLLICLGGVLAAPEAWLNLFSGYKSQQGRGHRSSYARPRSVGGKARYKAICRTINPDNYAFPGRLPYPAAPVCPY